MSDFPYDTGTQKYRRIAGLSIAAHYSHLPLKIGTAHGLMDVNGGTWIATDVNGYMYPITDEIFRKTYELVDDTQTPDRLDAAALNRIEDLLLDVPLSDAEYAKNNQQLWDDIGPALLAECRALAAERDTAEAYADDWKKLSITENERAAELRIINEALTAECASLQDRVDSLFDAYQQQPETAAIADLQARMLDLWQDDDGANGIVNYLQTKVSVMSDSIEALQAESQSLRSALEAFRVVTRKRLAKLEDKP